MVLFAGFQCKWHLPIIYPADNSSRVLIKCRRQKKYSNFNMRNFSVQFMFWKRFHQGAEKKICSWLDIIETRISTFNWPSTCCQLRGSNIKTKKNTHIDHSSLIRNGRINNRLKHSTQMSMAKTSMRYTWVHIRNSVLCHLFGPAIMSKTTLLTVLSRS